MVQVDKLSDADAAIMISNLKTAAWHFFFQKVTCNDQHILKSNEVKVQVYKNYLKHNHTLIYLDVLISIGDLRQKKLVQFFFQFLPR